MCLFLAIIGAWTLLAFGLGGAWAALRAYQKEIYAPITRYKRKTPPLDNEGALRHPNRCEKG